MKKRLYLYGLLAVLIAGVYYYQPYFENLYTLSVEKFQDLKTTSAVPLPVSEKKEISAPPPLRAGESSPNPVLTQKGVFEFTNQERIDNGRKALKENSELDAAAKKKAQDILAKQYFDHVNPDGKGPDYFVSTAGYDYLTIGENLALGNFADDKALVDAWMASPGHRENILRSQFQEIGIAVVRGNYEGETVWVAVQEFGAPSSACSLPNANLKSDIENNTSRISKMTDDLNAQKLEIKNISARDPDYSQMVDDYNALVAKYNSLAKETKNMIEKYNIQVNKYNSCLKSYQ
jgi:uncharacterized protein YkwD